MEWLMDQIKHFNVLMFFAIILVNFALSRASMQKIIKDHSAQLDRDFTELKDEIKDIRRIPKGE